MPYSGEIETAVIAKLLADATLMAMLPDGLFYDMASSGKTRFGIVKVLTHSVEQRFGGRAFETTTVLAKAVELATSSANTKAAAARIDTVLEGATLTITGYGSMNVQLEEHVRYVEPDPDNADARWQHAGGLYQVMASL